MKLLGMALEKMKIQYKYKDVSGLLNFTRNSQYYEKQQEKEKSVRLYETRGSRVDLTVYLSIHTSTLFLAENTTDSPKLQDIINDM